MLTSTEIVRAEGEDVLTTLVYKNVKTGEESVYHAPKGDTFGIFVFAGYEPETSLLQEKQRLIKRICNYGCFRTDQYIGCLCGWRCLPEKSSSGSDGSR